MELVPAVFLIFAALSVTAFFYFASRVFSKLSSAIRAAAARRQLRKDQVHARVVSVQQNQKSSK